MLQKIRNHVITKWLTIGFIPSCLTLFSVLTVFMSQSQTATVTFSPNDEQMANYSTSLLGTVSYTGSESVGILSYSADFSGTDADVARFRFDHPEFTNNKITKVVFGVNYSKWGAGTPGAAIAHVIMPKHIHNNAVAWNGLSFSEYEGVYNAVNWGDEVFMSGIGTSSISNVTEEFIIYDETLAGFPSTTLSFFDPSSNNFTLALRQQIGALDFNNVYVIVTYECDLPATAPAGLTAPLIESTEVALDWGDVVGATEYEVRKDGVPIGIAATSNFMISGLLPSTTYNFSVRAKNSCGPGASASVISVTTCSPKPEDLTVNSITTTTAEITWLGVPATNYKIRLDGVEIVTTISSSYTITGLSPGQMYTVSVEANSGDCWSDLTTVDVLTIPSAPSGLTVDPSSSSSLILTWSPVFGATQYKIYDCTTDALVNTSVAPFKTVFGLSPDTEYDFYVTANNASGESSASTCETGKTKLEVPGSFTSTALSTSSIECTWTTVPFADSYEIYTCAGVLVGSTTDDHITFTGLDQATTYSYKIKAISADNESNFSSCKSAITFPETPSGLVANGIGSTEILLTWTSPTGPSGFIEVFTDAGVLLGTTTGNEFTVNLLSPNTYYSFKIRQATVEEVSDYTPVVGDYTLLPRPDGVISTALTETSLRLNWNEVIGANYYEVYDCDGIYVGLVMSGADPMAELVVTGLLSGTSYTFTVIAYNGYNLSLGSFCINGYTKLPTPSGLTATAFTHSKITLNWSAVMGANSYNIYSCSGDYIGTSSTTSYVVEGLFPLTTYSFKIRAIFIDPDRIDPTLTINGSASSDFSACASATTLAPTSPIGGSKSLITNDNEEKEIIVYPNPFKDFLKVESELEIMEIRIYGVDGKLVFQTNNVGTFISIDTRDLSNGTYLLNVLTENGWDNRELIK